MAYNRIHHSVFDNHNWCKNCNLVTEDKSVLRCPSCGFKVRTKPRTFGKDRIKKEVTQMQNQSDLTMKFIRHVVMLQSRRNQSFTPKSLIKITTQKIGVNVLNA